MLTIRYVNPTGLFSFGKSANINIECRGLVNLIGVNDDTGGDSNGAGKSSFFNSMCEILYGENPTGVSGNGVVNDVWSQGYAGRVEFVSWEGVYYRVTSCRDWKEDFYAVDTDTKVLYKGTDLYFEKYENEQWKDIRGARMSDTRKLVLEAIGVTYMRFVSISYLSHRIGSRFLRGKNQERVDILAGITGVEEWDRILSSCRTEKNARVKKVEAAEQSIAYERGALEQVRQQLQQFEQTDWKGKVAQYGKQVKDAEGEASNLQVEIDKLTTQTETLSKQQREIYATSGITGLSQEISDLAAEEARLRNPGSLEDNLPSFDPAYEQKVQNSRSKVDVARGTVAVFLRKGDLRSLDICPTCGTKITKVRKVEMTKHFDQLQGEVQNLEVSHREDIAARDAHHAQVQDERAQTYAGMKAQADQIVLQIEKKRANMQASSSEYERLTEEIRQIGMQVSHVRVKQSAAQNEINTLHMWTMQAQKALQDMEVLHSDLEKRLANIIEMEDTISSSKDDLLILDWLISNIPYIKLHRLSLMMTALSEKVNQHLMQMGDTIRVNISSFEEKKSKRGAADAKDLLKSDVKVEVIDGEKNIDPRLYSDGETAKIANALIRALHEMALQGGHGCNVILLDEVFAFVDVTNSQRLVDSLTDVCAATTLVTDNSGHVNDLLPFNEVWVAQKQKGITRLGVQ